MAALHSNWIAYIWRYSQLTFRRFAFEDADITSFLQFHAKYVAYLLSAVLSVF